MDARVGHTYERDEVVEAYDAGLEVATAVVTEAWKRSAEQALLAAYGKTRNDGPVDLGIAGMVTSEA